jgi:uncharacterized protein
MHTTLVPWPSYARVLALEYTGRYNIGRRLRFAWNMGRSLAFRRNVDSAVDRCPWILPALERYPILLSPLTSGFLCARHSLRQRFAWFAHDVEFTSTRIHEQWPRFFQGEPTTTLWSDEVNGYRVDLSLNVAYPREGLWQLSLRTPGHPQLFCLRFSVLAGPSVFIGAVQGACQSEVAKVPELIRDATRDLHGLRPHFLLFEVLRALAQAWDIERIEGITTGNHVKHRRGRRGTGMRFSYDRYFEELGARRTLEGNWRAPKVAPQRSLAEVHSRKRAMYRRRHEMLEDMRATVNNAVRSRSRTKLLSYFPPFIPERGNASYA